MVDSNVVVIDGVEYGLVNLMAGYDLINRLISLRQSFGRDIFVRVLMTENRYAVYDSQLGTGQVLAEARSILEVADNYTGNKPDYLG